MTTSGDEGKHYLSRRCVGGDCPVCNRARRNGGRNAPNPKKPPPVLAPVEPVKSPPGKRREIRSLFDIE